MQCGNCGAPEGGNEVLCRYCRAPLSQELLASAVSCPTCKAPNRAERDACVACNGSLRRLCIFCQHASGLGADDCERCGEAFAGAQERKSARDAERLIGAVTDVVSAFTGQRVSARSSSSSSAGTPHRSKGRSDDEPPPMDS